MNAIHFLHCTFFLMYSDVPIKNLQSNVLGSMPLHLRTIIQQKIKYVNRYLHKNKKLYADDLIRDFNYFFIMSSYNNNFVFFIADTILRSSSLLALSMAEVGSSKRIRMNFLQVLVLQRFFAFLRLIDSFWLLQILRQLRLEAAVSKKLN